MLLHRFKNKICYSLGKTNILTTLRTQPIRELARNFGNTEMDKNIGATGIEIMLKR